MFTIRTTITPPFRSDYTLMLMVDTVTILQHLTLRDGMETPVDKFIGDALHKCPWDEQMNLNEYWYEMSYK